MNKYEAMYIVNPNVADDARAALVERFSGIVTNGGGNVEKIDDWGKRKLAYEIDDLTEGHYILMHFESATSKSAKMSCGSWSFARKRNKSKWR